MIGILIKQLREERRMSQKALATEVKMGTTAINNYENGHRVPDADTVIRLAEFFNVTTDYLLGKSPERNDKYAEDAKKQSKDIAELLARLNPNVRAALLPALEGLLLASGDGVAKYTAEFLLSFSRIVEAYTRGIIATDKIIAETAKANRLRDVLLSANDERMASLRETLEGLPDALSAEMPNVYKVTLSEECTVIRHEADGLYRDIPPLISKAIDDDCNAARLRVQGDEVPRQAKGVPNSGTD